MDGVNDGGIDASGKDLEGGHGDGDGIAGAGVGAAELPDRLLPVEEPPDHVWSAALYAALSADPAVAADLAALVPDDPGPTDEDGGVDGVDLGWDLGWDPGDGSGDGPPDEHPGDGPGAPGGSDLPEHHARIDDPGQHLPGAADPDVIPAGGDPGTDAWGEWSP